MSVVADRAVAAVAVRAAAFAGGAAALGAVHLPRPPTLCPLRATTGVPCPVCGTTTALVRLGRLDLPAALAANPVTLVALLALLLVPLARRPVRVPPVALVAAVVAAEAWQLARFDLLPT